MSKIDETAAAGSTSAGSIATVPSNRLGGMQTRMSLKDFMLKFHGGVVNRFNYKPVSEMKASIKSIEAITESAAHPYQLRDATSRLKDMETTGEYDEADIVTYGIQDDEGSMMLVTVPLDQGEELERMVAQSLADVLDYKKTGHGENKSLAELLYELKDQFTIIDAQFPTIPKNAIYNADEITEDLPSDGIEDDEEMSDEEMSDEEMGGDDALDLDDEAGGEEQSPNPDDMDIGDDFDTSDEPEDKESLLTAVLGMLKSQNEKEIAQAKADEEKAKAMQAQMAMKSAEAEMEKQESMVAAEAEMDAEKDREKEAKKMAELAKHRYKKRRSASEGFSPIFRSMLLELDPNDTVQSLRREIGVVRRKYKPDANDSPETVQHKRKQMNLAMRELNIKMRAARNNAEYQSKQADNQDDEADNQDDEAENNETI